MSNYPESFKVLVLSSEKEHAKIVVTALKKINLTKVSYKDNGLEALASMAAENYDFVICDQSVRQIKGWVFIKEIKLSEKVPNLPVILFGKEEAPESEEIMKRYGVLKYLKFPFRPSELDFLIHSTLTLFKTSGTIEHKFTEAKGALIAKNSDEAVELYSELKVLTKNSMRSNVGLAQAYEQKNDHAKVEEITSEIVQGEEDSPTRIMLQARVALKKKQVDVAKPLLEKLIKDVGNEFYYSRAVRLLLEHNEYKAGESIATEAIEKGYKQAEFYVCVAKNEFAKGNYQNCIDNVDIVGDEAGMDSELYNLKGVCFKKMGSIEAAIQCYEEALNLEPTQPKYYFNMAICFIEEKDFETSIYYLEKCIQVDPSFKRAQEKLEEMRSKMAS